jgi:hypothetical protein
MNCQIDSNRLVAARTILLCLLPLAGCAGLTEVKFPQSADEFLSTYNWGGLFQNKENLAVNRPVGVVVADTREFAKNCMDIKVNKKRAARYAMDKYGSGTRGDAIPYNAKVGPLQNGATGLSIQEVYDQPQKGTPPGGMFTLVAEIRGVNKTKTEVNIYHLKRPFLADPLKKWVEGDKRDCPAL